MELNLAVGNFLWKSPNIISGVLLYNVTLEPPNLISSKGSLLISPNIFPAIFSAYTVYKIIRMDGHNKKIKNITGQCTLLNHCSITVLKVRQEQVRIDEVFVFKLQPKYYTGRYLYLYKVISQLL